jgi:hypothetical protein
VGLERYDTHCSYGPIRSYVTRLLCVPLPYKHVLKYRTRKNVCGISILVFNTKCARECRPHFAACGNSGSGYCGGLVPTLLIMTSIGCILSCSNPPPHTHTHSLSHSSTYSYRPAQNGHSFPSLVPADIQKEIIDYCFQCVLALGFYKGML